MQWCPLPKLCLRLSTPIPCPFEMLVVLCHVLDCGGMSSSVRAAPVRCSEDATWLDGLMLGQAGPVSWSLLSVPRRCGRQGGSVFHPRQFIYYLRAPAFRGN